MILQLLSSIYFYHRILGVGEYCGKVKEDLGVKKVAVHTGKHLSSQLSAEAFGLFPY